MEVGESGTRQSGIPSVSTSSDPFSHHRRESDHRPLREGSAMATATLISPSNPYPSYHAPSFSSGYHAPPPPPAQTSNIHSMVSPPEPRRTSDEPDAPHRQSLPSIQEVIQSAKGPSQYPQSAPPTGPPAPSLPSPFSTSAPSRPYGEAATDPNPSPRTLHPTTNFARPDPTPTFSDPARHSVSSRAPPPPLNTFPAQHPSPPRNEPEQRHPEPHGAYSHAPPQPALYAQTGRLPPGQLPLTGYDVSPRQAGHALPSPYEAQRPPMYEDGDYSQRSNEYKAAGARVWESWSYGDSLTEISTGARTIYAFADAFEQAAREQQGSRAVPSRLPVEDEVTSMINAAMHVTKKLEEVREMVQQNRLNNERARTSGSRKHYDDEDIAMYNDGMKQPFALNEVKKRRGRAAPPGRCHSCNRVDTPEWRRGPDGARTLCNACGLHYAKLERKRQLEQRNLRPKPADERN